MAGQEFIEVQVNGEKRKVPKGQTILELIQSLNLIPERLAVELNRQIIKREQWATTEIPEGAEVEIVQFVGGG